VVNQRNGTTSLPHQKPRLKEWVFF
jgi:hypothetical protein